MYDSSIMLIDSVSEDGIITSKSIREDD
jgi:hypothetical protein